MQFFDHTHENLLSKAIIAIRFASCFIFDLCSAQTQPDRVYLVFVQCDEVRHGAIGFSACHVFATPAYEIGTAPARHTAAAICPVNVVRDTQPDHVILLYKPATRVGFPHVAALPYGEARRKAGLTKFP